MNNYRTCVTSIVCSLICLCGLAGCSRRPAEEAERQLQARIIQCEAARSEGRDRFLSGLLGDRGRSVELRRRAALALGRIGDPASIPALLKGAGDPLAGVRSRSLFAIGEIIDAENARLHSFTPGEETIAAVRKGLQDSSAEVRARVVEALGKAGRREWLENLPGMAPDPAELSEEPLRLYAREWIKAAARLQHPECVPGIVRLFRGPERLTALKMANRLLTRLSLKPEVPVEVMVDLLADPEPDVRAAALRIGPLVDPPLNLTQLANGLADPSHQVRVGAVAGLGRSAHEGAAGTLISFVEAQFRLLTPWDSREKSFRLKEIEVAVGALGALKTPEAVAALEKWLPRDEFMAPRCLQAITAARPEAPLPEGTRLPVLKSPSAVLKWLQAVGEGDHPSRQEYLRELEGGRLPPGWRPEWVRAARPFYLPALLRASLPGDFSAATFLLQDPDPYVRAAVMDWLQQRTEEFPADLLEQVCLSVDRHAQANAPDADISALPLLAAAGEHGRTQLERLLASPFYAVRLRAAKTLADLGNRAAYARIVPMPTQGLDLYRNIVDRWEYGCLASLVLDKGRIVIELDRRETPLTAMHFLELAGQSFYKEIQFHRVVPDFVAQAGCPLGSGNGGAGDTIPCEITPGEYRRGAVGMALAGKDTGSSQFFVTLSPQPHLDGGYTIFGRVVGGMDVADALLEGDRIRAVEVNWDIPWEQKQGAGY